MRGVSNVPLVSTRPTPGRGLNLAFAMKKRVTILPLAEQCLLRAAEEDRQQFLAGRSRTITSGKTDGQVLVLV